MYWEDPSSEIFDFAQSADIFLDLNTLSTGESIADLIVESSNNMEISKHDLSKYLNLENSSVNLCLSQVNNWKTKNFDLTNRLESAEITFYDVYEQKQSNKTQQLNRKNVLQENKRKDRKSKKLQRQMYPKNRTGCKNHDTYSIPMTDMYQVNNSNRNSDFCHNYFYK